MQEREALEVDNFLLLYWEEVHQGTKGLGKGLCSAGELGLARHQRRAGGGFGEDGERTWETHQSLELYRDMLILFCHSKLARSQMF